MTRIALVVGLCVLGVVGAASAAPSDIAANRAQLRMMSVQPMVVRGTGFEASERVHVIVGARTMYSKTKVANTAGVFTVRFDVPVAECGSRYWVKAFGNKGSRAFALSGRYFIGCIDPPVNRTN